MKLSPISVILILLAFGFVIWGIISSINNRTQHAWVCPDEVAAQHRAFVIACTMHSGQGVNGCTIDADQLFCIKQEIQK